VISVELGKEAVGNNVKKAREIKSQAIGCKYTQKMLSQDTAYSQGYISDVESGRSGASRDFAIATAKATGVTLDFIFGTERESEVTKPVALQKIKESFSEMLDIVYLPVIGNISAGKPILADENIEYYLPYPAQEYNPERNFVLRVQGESMKDAGILDGDLVVIRQQPVAENGQIVAVRFKDNGVTLKKFYYENETILLKPCNAAYEPMKLNENIEIIGIAVSITKKLA
jgi:repressor LexA